MDNPEAARLAESLRAAMTTQGLNLPALAERVERLTGERPDRMRVSRWTSGARPLIRISPDLAIVADALGLDPVDLLCDAIRAAAADRVAASAGA